MEQEKLLYRGELKPSESEQHLLEGEYVSDSLGDQIETVFSTINCLCQEEPIAIIICAQSGTGKNHFITHELREYAREHGEKILYVSNRLALDYQQKKELHNMLDSLQGFRRVSNSEVLQNYCVFGNVTVITYHKLYKWMISQSQQGADTDNHRDAFNFDTNPESYRYVILDECHFFYSDAMFYPHTWEIMENIPYFFRNSFRIYMTATPEEVQEPIRCCEDNLLGCYGYRTREKQKPKKKI